MKKMITLLDRTIHRQPQNREDEANRTNNTPPANTAGDVPPPLPPTRPRNHPTVQMLRLTNTIPAAAGELEILSAAIENNSHQPIDDLDQELRSQNKRCTRPVGPMLESAIRGNKSDAVKQSLVNLHGADATEMLKVAVRHREWDLAKRLLKQGAMPAKTQAGILSDRALKRKDMEFLKSLLKQGVTLDEDNATRILAIALGDGDDVELISLLLRQRGRPVFNADGGNTETRQKELLYAAKRIVDLYPDRFDPEEEMRRLENYKTEKGISNDQDLWIQTMDPEILRAMLVLKDEVVKELAATRATNPLQPERQTMLHLGKMNADIHPAILDQLKRYGYYSEKAGRTQWDNLNELAEFPDGESVDCRSLTWYWLWKRATNPDGEFDYSDIKDRESIEENLPDDAVSRYDALLACSAEVHLVSRSTFGADLIKLFQSKDRPMNDGDEDKMLVAMTTPGHSLGAELEIKCEDGEKTFTVNFYDANVSLAHKRIRTTDPATFERMALVSLLAGTEWESEYFRDGSEPFLLYVVPRDESWEPVENRTAPQYGADGRCLSSLREPPDGAAIAHILQKGFDGTLKKLGDWLKSIDPMEAAGLLSYELEFSADKRYTGFNLALDHELTSTVKTFMEITNALDIPDAEKIRLLKAIDASGATGLGSAITKERVESIVTYMDELNHLTLKDERRKEDVIAELAGNGGLDRNVLLAMLNADEATLKAYIQAVGRLEISAAKKDKLLSSCAQDGKNVLCELAGDDALDPEMLRTYINCVSELKLPDQVKQKLLAGAHGNSSLMDVLERTGQRDLIAVYNQAVKQTGIPAAMKRSLLPQAEH